MHDFHYLPAIISSPTKYDTVQEVLTQMKDKAEALGLPCTDLELDHAIYAKAFEFLQNSNNANLKEFINLRTGGFYACFLAGKRFRCAGLYDLIVEPCLLQPESVKQILNDKAYNYRIISEALQRTHLHVFNPLSANPTKWSNTLKQFVGKLPTNYLSVFDHFVNWR